MSILSSNKQKKVKISKIKEAQSSTWIRQTLKRFLCKQTYADAAKRNMKLWYMSETQCGTS